MSKSETAYAIVQSLVITGFIFMFPAAVVYLSLV